MIMIHYKLFAFNSTNLQRPGDLKESFDFSVLEDENFVSFVPIINTL